MKKYFMNRKQWGIETEKILSRALKRHQKYWSEIMEQRIKQAKDKIFIEKQSEIRHMTDIIISKDQKISKLQKESHEIEKYKNDLLAKIQNLDYQNKLLEEFQNQVSIRIGMNDSIIKSAEKMVKKYD